MMTLDPLALISSETGPSWAAAVCESVPRIVRAFLPPLDKRFAELQDIHQDKD
jgi:hypothetical protein